MKYPRYPLKHPRLVDIVRNMLRDSGMTQLRMAQRYSVSLSFIESLLAGRHCPNADIIQLIYEDLAGCPLLKTPRQPGKLTGRGWSKHGLYSIKPANVQAEK